MRNIMLKTEAERRKAANHIVADMRLEGIEPYSLGTTLMERIIKGEITAEEALHSLDQYYFGNPIHSALTL